MSSVSLARVNNDMSHSNDHLEDGEIILKLEIIMKINKNGTYIIRCCSRKVICIYITYLTNCGLIGVDWRSLKALPFRQQDPSFCRKKLISIFLPRTFDVSFGIFKI